MIRRLGALHLAFAFLSLASVCGKLAAGAPAMSVRFFLCYGGMLVILFGYALAWQRLIARIPLSTAFAHRAMTVVWGVAWGITFFGETVRPMQWIGIAMIAGGIVLYAQADRRTDHG